MYPIPSHLSFLHFQGLPFIPATLLPIPQSPVLHRSLCLGPFFRGPGTANLLPSCSNSPFLASVQDPGLHVWRVEKLKPVPVAKENQGVFFSGDSYLVLHNGPEELSHLHLWIGEGLGPGRALGPWGWHGSHGPGPAPPTASGQQSSRDEQGACAVLAVHLNTLLGERPVQHREVQGNESDLFMSYFPTGLKYQVSPPCSFPQSLPPLPAAFHPAKGPGILGAGSSPPFCPSPSGMGYGGPRASRQPTQAGHLGCRKAEWSQRFTRPPQGPPRLLPGNFTR